MYNYLQTHTVALYANSPLVELHCISVGRQDVDSVSAFSFGIQCPCLSSRKKADVGRTLGTGQTGKTSGKTLKVLS